MKRYYAAEAAEKNQNGIILWTFRTLKDRNAFCRSAPIGTTHKITLESAMKSYALEKIIWRRLNDR